MKICDEGLRRQTVRTRPQPQIKMESLSYTLKVVIL